MAWRVKVRYKSLNNNEVMLQRSSMPFILKVLVLPIPLLWWMFAWDWWRDWQLRNNELYETEHKIAKKVEDIEKLLEKRKRLQATLKQELKEIDDSKRYRRGESEPWLMEVKLKDRLFFTRYPDLDPPEGSWRKMLDKKFVEDKPKPTGLREKLGASAHPMSSGVTGYVLDESHSIRIGEGDSELPVDSVRVFKEPNKKSGSNNGNRNWRKRRQNESPEEHQERLRQADEEKEYQD